MANLSKIKREKMLEFLEKLKESIPMMRISVL